MRYQVYVEDSDGDLERIGPETASLESTIELVETLAETTEHRVIKLEVMPEFPPDKPCDEPPDNEDWKERGNWPPNHGDETWASEPLSGR